MAGTKVGGQKAAATNKRKYGPDFYAGIGAKGGSKSKTGGYYHMSLHDPERHRQISAVGGQLSRRTGIPNKKGISS